MSLNFSEESGNETGAEGSNCTMYFDQPQFTNVAIVNLFIGIVSFISSVLVIIFIVLSKKWKFFSERLILYLTITAMLFSIANIINRVDINNREKSSFLNGWCAFSGAATQITSWMAFFAISSITFYLFFGSALNRNTEKYEWAYLVLIFVVPLIFNWIPFIDMLYGRSGVWCWIRSFDYASCKVLVFGMWLQFSLLYIPRYILLVVLFTLYIIIIVKICRRRRSEQGNDPNSSQLTKLMLSEVVTLLAYPSVYFILSLPLLLNQVYKSFEPSKPKLLLWYFSGIALPLHGFFTAVIFTSVTACRQRVTWTKLRARARQDSMVQEYPVKPNVMSESLAMTKALSTCQHKTVDYTAYV